MTQTANASESNLCRAERYRFEPGYTSMPGATRYFLSVPTVYRSSPRSLSVRKTFHVRVDFSR